MSRILFKRAAPGRRLVRGALVRAAQAALRDHGADPGDLDGIFGGDSEAAVKRWRAEQGLPGDGALTFDDWARLTGRSAPSVLDRALQLTGDFEGHGFGVVKGNFDGAWLTWGIIGFTLKHGEVQRILNEVRQSNPDLLRAAFGPLEAELLAALDGSAAEQEAFANRISQGESRVKVAPAWTKAFERLGSFEPVQAIQLRGVAKYWDMALGDADRLGLETERGQALCFDIAVQNGGVSADEQAEIDRRLAQQPPVSEAAKCLLIADVVAEASNPRWVEDVRSRKRTIAGGRGTVHGADYDLADWAIEEVAAG